MTVSRLIAPALVCAAIATPAAADVTLRLNGSGGIFGGQQSDSTEYHKGPKLRIDYSSNGVRLTSIVDMRTGHMIMLFHDRKEAEVIDSKQISESLAKSGFPETRQSITPTAQSRQIAGSTCIVHNVKGSSAMVAMEMVPTMTMVMEGSMCLVKNGPGQADFTAFYRASAKSPFILGPGQAGKQPGASAMTEMYRQMAELGVPFATEITIGFEDNGPTAEMMKQIGGTYTTEVSSVSTAPIPDSMFEVPADYKVIQR